MNITSKTVNDIIIIEAEGSIDSKTAPEFEKSALTEAKEKTKVILDLTKVDFLSSAGLRVLLMLYRQINASQGKVVLAGVSEEIKDVMSNTGFYNFFTFVDTADQGLQSF